MTQQSRALISRSIDFWLLGGASILVWFVMFMLAEYRGHPSIDKQFKNLAITTVTLSLIINNPHFIASYKLAYFRGWRFLIDNRWQLVVIPLAMIAMFAVAYMAYDAPPTTVPGLTEFIGMLTAFGANTSFLSAPKLGDLIFTWMFILMFFTVGWHYTKQAFGCMMVYAEFDGYKLSKPQRELIRWNLLGIWWLNFTEANLYGRQQELLKFKYYPLDLPDIFLPITKWILVIGFLLVLALVFFRNYRDRKQLPSLTMLAPFVAMYVWWLPITRERMFFIYLTPLFHSIQYLPFVYKVERTRMHGTKHFELKATILTLGIILTGWLVFDFFPNTFDSYLEILQRHQILFFAAAAMLFVNIHHYFIDNVLWRFRDPSIKKYLLD